MPDEAYNDFLALCTSRYSCRNYDPSRPVPRELVDKCLEAARLAPSACNRQPWRFVVVDEPKQCKTICDTCRMAGVPHPWWDDVPIFIALCVDREFFTHKFAASISGLPYWALDVGIAGEHFVLAADALGLASCWVGWFNEKKLKKALNIPRSIKVLSLITLGYAAGPRPEKPRPRKDHSEITHYNRWQK